MDLRKYLQKHRDYRKLNEILLQVVSGLQELHSLGYVHRDLKPENIVVSIDRPIKVALIDFDRALPKTMTCHTGCRGTPGYQPDNALWYDGCQTWDKYALACIVLECDMEKDEYIRAKDERVAKTLIKKHVENKGTCEHIFALSDRMILRYDSGNEPSYDEIAGMIKKMKFRLHK